jgi:hypothetical protein
MTAKGWRKRNTHIPDATKMVVGVKDSLTTQQEQGPVACDNCKKLTDELERLRIKAELWKQDSIVWKSAYDVEVGFREQEQGEPVAKYIGEDWAGSLVSLYEDLPLNTLLYTTPQQRTWVGLTDEEKDLFSSWLDCKEDDEVFEAIEAKLKEKNT